MSMTYCSCRRCGEPLLLDAGVIATRGYLCDDCFKKYGLERFEPVQILSGCPHCDGTLW